VTAGESALEETDGPVTVSMGCTCLRDGDRDYGTGLLDRVDRALYLSKAQGKNRTNFQ